MAQLVRAPHYEFRFEPSCVDLIFLSLYKLTVWEYPCKVPYSKPSRRGNNRKVCRGPVGSGGDGVRRRGGGRYAGGPVGSGGDGVRRRGGGRYAGGQVGSGGDGVRRRGGGRYAGGQ